MELENSMEYLKSLEKDMNHWVNKLNSMPGNTVDPDVPIYKLAVHYSAKYVAAKHMMDLMKKDFGI